MTPKTSRRMHNECTEAAIPDLWNVWGESARRTHYSVSKFLLSWTSELLKCSFIGFLFYCFCDKSWLVEFPVFQILLNFHFCWISTFVEFPLFQFCHFAEFPLFLSASTPTHQCMQPYPLGTADLQNLASCIAHINHLLTPKMNCWMPAEPNHDLWKIYFTASTVYVL